MDPRLLETLAKRLGENANDTEALNAAYEHGQTDPRGYAVFLEKAGAASLDPTSGAHWYCEAANVWTASLSDNHRAERALVRAVEKDPLQPTANDRLVELYRAKGDIKAIAALQQRRAKSSEPSARETPEFAPHVAAIYAELARLFSEELGQPDKAIESYRKAASVYPGDAYSIYQARELLKGAGRLKEALPYFAMEQALIQGDPERQAALYADEAEVCRGLGDTDGLLRALQGARAVSKDDPGLKQQFGSTVLELVQAGVARPSEEIAEGTRAFVELAETYDGEYGHSYSLCALGLDPGNDRAAQLAMHYGAQINKSAETAHPMAAYLAANPDGAVAEEARALLADALSKGADDSLIAALTPKPTASPEAKITAFGVLARAMRAQGRTEDAAKYYGEIVALSPADEEAVLVLAEGLRGKKPALLKDLLLRAAEVESAGVAQRSAWLSEVAELCEGPLADVSSAIEARRQLVLLDPSDEGAADLLEETLEKAEKWDDLADLLERRAQVDADPRTQIEREVRAAEIHRTRRRDALSAASALARAAKLEPDDEVRAFEAAELFVSAGAPQKAVLLLSSLLQEMLGGDARANYSLRLAEILETAGQLVEAGGAYSEAASGKSDPDLWAKAQECFQGAEAWEQAARAVSERRALVDDELEKGELCAQEAEYLTQLGDGEGAISCLREALKFNPKDSDVFAKLDAIYTEASRFGELVTLLITRALAETDPKHRVSLRKRAAFLQRDQLDDLEGMRAALLEALEDGDDIEALRILADDAQSQGMHTQTVDYLRRLGDALGDSGRGEVALRLARLLEEEEDEEGALEQYLIAQKGAPDDVDILSAVAHLQQATGDQAASADSYKRLLGLCQGDQKLATARILAGILAALDRPLEAIDAYKVVLELDETDLETVENLRDLAEGAELWEDFATYHAMLVDVEGDENEASRMVLRLASVLEKELGRAEDAFQALIPFAKEGDDPCMTEYLRLGDELSKQAEVAASLHEWMKEAPAGPKRNKTLRAAYDRFLQVKNHAKAIEVGLELVRMKGAAEELAVSLEEAATKEKHLEALQAAFVVLGRDISGPPRAEEMVRQAEVLVQAGMPSAEAVLHGEQALTSTSPADVEPLLSRLATLAGEGEAAVGVYERQVSRCKSSSERTSALCRAAEVAVKNDQSAKVTQFFEIALNAAGQSDGLDELRETVRRSDELAGSKELRTALTQVLASAGKGARDGGRSHATYLATAASVAYEDLRDLDKAFTWLGEALMAHADEAGLDQLVKMGEAEGALERVAQVIGNALEKVNDGPLVRMLLRRRLELREGPLADPEGAGRDLKQLYDLSPADGEIAERLETLYKDRGDDRGLVQLYEDQILRGRDQAARADLAKRVALLWQDTLEEPREAADAWRRVLRMNSGDAEAKEGLERAKKGMRKVSAKQIVESEKQTRKELEAKLAQEEAEAARREKELEEKARELKARHSNPPPRLWTISRRRPRSRSLKRLPRRRGWRMSPLLRSPQNPRQRRTQDGPRGNERESAKGKLRLRTSRTKHPRARRPHKTSHRRRPPPRSPLKRVMPRIEHLRTRKIHRMFLSRRLLLSPRFVKMSRRRRRSHRQMPLTKFLRPPAKTLRQMKTLTQSLRWMLPFRRTLPFHQMPHRTSPSQKQTTWAMRWMTLVRMLAKTMMLARTGSRRHDQPLRFRPRRRVMAAYDRPRRRAVGAWPPLHLRGVNCLRPGSLGRVYRHPYPLRHGTQEPFLRPLQAVVRPHPLQAVVRRLRSPLAPVRVGSPFSLLR